MARSRRTIDKFKRLSDENNIIRAVLESGQGIPANFESNLNKFRAGQISARDIVKQTPGAFVTTGRGFEDVTLPSTVRNVTQRTREPLGLTAQQARARQVALEERQIRLERERQKIREEAEETIDQEEVERILAEEGPSLFDRLVSAASDLFRNQDEEQPGPVGQQLVQELINPSGISNEFDTEEEARAAGFQNGDEIVIRGKGRFRLAPDKNRG